MAAATLKALNRSERPCSRPILGALVNLKTRLLLGLEREWRLIADCLVILSLFIIRMFS